MCAIITGSGEEVAPLIKGGDRNVVGAVEPRMWLRSLDWLWRQGRLLQNRQNYISG